MQWLIEFFTNPFLLTGAGAWCVAQVMKVIIHALVNRKLDITRLFGDGGMPSGHSATVTALSTITLLVYGPSSFEFAVTAILTLIVCHDATGVRQEAGKHAVLLDELVILFQEISKEPLPEVRLKKFVGHTKIQVFCGMGIGVLFGILMYGVFFG